MQSILVTGGAGFIGSCFCREWRRRDESKLVVYDKLTYAGSLDSLQPNLDDGTIELVQADICDSDRLAQVLLQYQPQAIVHLAAESHVDRSIAGPAEFVLTNVVGTSQLLEATREYWSGLDSTLRDAFRFVHVSTDEVYGSIETGYSSAEGDAYEPNSPYAASKASSDHFVRAYFQTYGLPTIVTNCSNNYGPYQHPEKLIPTMILAALYGETLPVYGDGLNVRDWLHVEDHCAALRLILDRGVPGESYNIGGNCELTNLHVVNKICELVDDRLKLSGPESSSSRVTMVNDRLGHDRRYSINCEKLQSALDWRPQIGFDEGLRQTVAWYADNATWVRRVKHIRTDEPSELTERTEHQR